VRRLQPGLMAAILAASAAVGDVPSSEGVPRASGPPKPSPLMARTGKREAERRQRQRERGILEAFGPPPQKDAKT
jgi:hypothetical protein